MPCIYLSINHWNKHYGILPYLYIGSNQSDNKKYFGSNKQIKEDLKVLGPEFFEKKILKYYDFIDNKLLRKNESELLVELDCANDAKYYNKTNTSLPGYRETVEEKKIRIQNSVKSRKIKKDILGYIVPIEKRNFKEKNHMYNKTLYFFWERKYGEVIAKEKWEEHKKHNQGNQNAKKITEQQISQIKNLVNQKKSHKEIAELLKLNFWTVVRYGNKKQCRVMELVDLSPCLGDGDKRNK